MGTWDNPNYCWIVICKNKKVHRETNLMFGHRIPLGETDAVEPVPLSGPISVQCDECSQEHSYEPAEVLRVVTDLPESFTSHPRFR